MTKDVENAPNSDQPYERVDPGLMEQAKEAAQEQGDDDDSGQDE